MRPLSSSRGQASLEYVASLALVSMILGAAATTIAAPRLAPRVAGAMRHGICVVSGALCSASEARAEGLAACAVRVRSNAERATAKVTVVRVDRDDAVLVEERSDGRVAISFSDGWRAGGVVAVGVRFAGGGGQLEGSAGVSFTAGRTYVLPDRAAARRFLATYARHETLTGEGRGAVRAVCRRCARLLGDRGAPPALPAPAETYVEGGAWAELLGVLGLAAGGKPAAGVGPDLVKRGPDRAPDLVKRGDDAAGGAGLPVGLAAEGGAGLILGRRTAGPTVTWYVRAGRHGLAQAGALLAAIQARGEHEVVLELTEQDGRPVAARLRAVAETGGELPALGGSVDLASAVRWARGTVSGRAPGHDRGARLQAQVALDLRDPANRRAIEGVLRPGASPLEWAERVRALGHRLDVDGAVDLTLSRTARAASRTDALVPGLGGGYERIEHVQTLAGAWSRAGGGPLREREDCEAGATAV